MVKDIGDLHIYTCDRCKHAVEIRDDPDETIERRPRAFDPLGRRRHEPPIAWIIVAAAGHNDNGTFILGPHGGNGLWCFDCSLEFQKFAHPGFSPRNSQTLMEARMPGTKK